MRDAVVFMAGPGDTGISGGDVHALRLVDRWRAQGASVELVAPPRVAHVMTTASAAREVSALRTPLDGHMRSIAVYTAAIALRTVQAMRIAAPARIAVASSHFAHDVLPAAWLRRRHGARVAVYAYHLVGQAGRARSLRSAISILGERLSLALLRRTADIVFVDNAETSAALLRAGFRDDQLRTTRNAYDPLEDLPPRSEPSMPTIVFVGRLVAVKGVDVVLDIARELAARAIPAQVVLLGDGPDRERLERRIGAEDLGNVSLEGFVSEDEKWRALSGATLFVSPSREEGWGIAVGEALLAGTPALVFDLPAYEHFADLPERVRLGDDAAFVARAVEIAADGTVHEALRARVVAGQARLPRWADVLNAELTELEPAA